MHCRTVPRGRHSSGCVRDAWFSDIFYFLYHVLSLLCMHGWHRAVVLFLEHLITIDTPRLKKMFFYLVKECSLGFLFFSLHNFSLAFWKERLFFWGGCLFNFSLNPSAL